MSIISFSPHGIIFLLIVTLGSASLFHCCFSLDAQYQYCQNNTKCGTMDIRYPFGVGSRGCGLPSFQINCVQNSNSVLVINGRSYTILTFLSSTLLVVTRGQNCSFLNNSTNNPIAYSAEFAGTNFTFKATEILTLYVYKCKEQGHLDLPKCNATGYYSLYANGTLNGSYEKENSTSACSMEPVLVYGVLIQAVADPKNKSCSPCEASNGRCGYNTSRVSTATPPFVCYCKDGPRTHKCPGHGRPRNKAIIIKGCFIGGAALMAGLLLVYYLKNRKPPPDGVLPRHLNELEMGNLPIFSYEELRQTTNCFHKENELGVGGFGSVYLGKLWGGRLVAVKRLYQDNSRRLEQFIHEVKMFSTLNHPHVVRLYGCTPLDSPELLLVYEFIPNGTLADHLHGNRKNPNGLPWNTRLNIATQTAETLAFLHALDPPILHRDVKTSNILLDENSDIKLCDFGLSKVVPVDASHVTTIPQGTPGYVDPEYYQCYKLTEKSDVYSFGVVLLELISAKQAMDINRNKGEINLANLAITKIQEGALHELVDP